MELEVLLRDLREYEGLKRKAVIGRWAKPFLGTSPFGPGDDAGAVAIGGGYLLLSGEGIWPELLEDPFFAGFCAVTVNVNDIYAMGGRPLGLFSVVFTGGFSEEQREDFLSGMKEGLEHYGVPLLGGHTSPWDKASLVAVSIVGFADNLLRGDGAVPGDALLVACDLKGRKHPSFYAWDTVTGVEGRRTVQRLEAIRELAEKQLCSSCRDVSNPGLLGTLAMMLESAGASAEVSIDDIPKPEGVGLEWWLKAYPSYGFLLTAPPGNVRFLGAILDKAGVDWAQIGRIGEGSEIVVRQGGKSALFLDWRQGPVTGLFSD
jgi:selenophosphate synthetase-related protein